MKVALVYDRVNKWGGAERILLALHKIFPKAPLYTSIYNPKTAPWAKVFVVKTSFLQNIPFSSHHEWFAPMMPFAFEQFNFDQYDLVISVTSEAAKGIKTNGKTKHLCICLTPTRYLWSGYNEYFKNSLFRSITKPLINFLRSWDKKAAQRPDIIISISKEVQARVKKYYGRESTVVYPPVSEFVISSNARDLRTSSKISQSFSNGELPRNDNKGYFLVVSRLSKFTQYKRVDLAIKAANKLGLPLKIVGDGNIAYFKKLAGQTVEFVGKVTDKELIFYYCNAKALIFPAHEDFGLVMVEAQLYGKPVIAYKAGGAKEIVIEGKTGEFFANQTTASLVQALKNFRESDYNRLACLRNAQKFSFRLFKKRLIRVIKEYC